jgi:glycolate oxidase FAD binding subunit
LRLAILYRSYRSYKTYRTYKELRDAPPMRRYLDNQLTFDCINHLPVAVPNSVPELCELVRLAAASKQAIYPFGGQTMLEMGLIPTRPGTGVDLRKLNQVIDYPARDMTITVQAGITITVLNEVLRSEKQRLPVDIPLPDRATLGGAIAANASGPRRFGLGTLRDYVIGISIVNDKGQEVKAGGRVVKNVAGYDLMKLYTGSLGTLGIISQVTLKLKPYPESSSLLALPVDTRQIASILDALNGSRTRPACIDLLDPAAGAAIRERLDLHILSGSAWRLVIGFEDNFKAVAWQIQQLRQELPAELRSSLEECPPDDERNLWSILSDFALWPEARLSFKANLRPSAVPEFCARAASLTPAPLLQAHAGNGIIFGHFRDLTIEQTGSMLELLGTLAEKANGNLIVTRCPAPWKSVLPVWGRPTADRILMKAIKEKLDPGNIFNPGRFVDGI